MPRGMLSKTGSMKLRPSPNPDLPGLVATGIFAFLMPAAWALTAEVDIAEESWTDVHGATSPLAAVREPTRWSEVTVAHARKPA